MNDAEIRFTFGGRRYRVPRKEALVIGWVT